MRSTLHFIAPKERERSVKLGRPKLLRNYSYRFSKIDGIVIFNRLCPFNLT